jgi:NADH:ubiquinone oxidoreductase subunit
MCYEKKKKGCSMIVLKILTWVKGRFVGEDHFGNRYYRERFLFMKPTRRPKRWVVYKGEPEASKIPPEWFSWVHYISEEPLKAIPHSWQKVYTPNGTGTKNAYLPPFHHVRGGRPFEASKHFQSWDPKQE